MSEHVRKSRQWLWLGLCIIFLGGSLAVVVTTWLASGPSLSDLGLEAYGRERWAEAADLARRQLRAAPDDRESLRLLARATARLGNDAQSNALFARLGNDALKAEDLFLLGQGLNRAGQADSAIGVWEKALADDPKHAEALERLALAYTSRNRLVEAAGLYERLANRPGWEFQGEVNLASLRAELNDPAGAGAILERALKRSPTDATPPGILAGYRKLLARVLLRTGQSARATAELADLLRSGPDPEASWLLSRAFLQKGDKPQAQEALHQAGSYRFDHPLELEPAPYVGEGRCSECHKEIDRAFHGSRFTTTLLRGRQLLELPYPDHPIPDPSDPTVTHRFQESDGQVTVETKAADKVFRAIVDYAFGSPDRYVSLVGHDANGRSHILRLSRYQNGPGESGWVRTTGHTMDADSGRDFLGKPIDPADGVLKCLFCHSTNPHAVLANSGPESNDRAIGCERCHGPGGNHLKAVDLKLSDMAIISPAQGSGEGSVRLCAQCHALHQELDLPRTDPFWIRFQGTTLAWSRCFTESGGAFDCLTCHDPHRNAEHSSAFYEAKCLSCHASSTVKGASGQPGGSETSKTSGGMACPINPARDCLGCHMPTFRSQPLHATFADHYIRVHPELKLPPGVSARP